MKKTALLFCILLVVVSCGKKEIKPVSRESKTALEAFKLADEVRQEFIKRDFAAIRQNSTEEGYDAIAGDKTSFDSLELTFTPRWVEIDKDRVVVNISWTSNWVIGGKEKQDSGMAVFVMKGLPLKVAAIERANPFVAPAD